MSTAMPTWVRPYTTHKPSCFFCFCWLLLAAAGFAAFCCLLLLGVDTSTHVVGSHTRYTKHTEAAKAHGSHIFPLFSLYQVLFCCCII